MFAEPRNGQLEPASPVNRPKNESDQHQATDPTVSIILQSTVGGFSAQFMRKLPLVEQAMREHGLEPSEFVISKDYASTATIPLMGPFFYSYSVFFGDEKFTVTEPNDLVFLDYFFKRVLAVDGPPELPERPGLLRRFFGWMSEAV